MRGRTARGRRALQALILALVASGAACSLFWERPTVRIADVRVSGIGLSGANADIVLRIVNPNGFALTSKGLRYRLEFEDPEVRASGDDDPWRTLAEGESDRRVTVEGDDSATVTVSVPFRYRDVGRAVTSLVREGRLRYRLDGDILFDAPLGGARIPFDDAGQVGL